MRFPRQGLQQGEMEQIQEISCDPGSSQPKQIYHLTTQHWLGRHSGLASGIRVTCSGRAHTGTMLETELSVA